MKTRQYCWNKEDGWNAEFEGSGAQLVLVFGAGEALASRDALEALRAAYPSAELVGCSTAGEICDTRVHDDSLVATVVELERSEVRVERIELEAHEDSRGAGAALGRALSGEGLAHVFVLSDGLSVNGSELAAGLASELPESVAVTGGLSGDGARFERTVVLDGVDARSGLVTAIGFYGAGLEVGYASLGGWDAFGPERVITRSDGNVLYELGGRSALALYKEYLGPEAAAGLPATGLLFPLAVRRGEGEEPVVRTILAVDEEAQSMTFAGDLPEGSYARLMRANFDRLVEGAAGAARGTGVSAIRSAPELALLVSCVGRKMVLKQRVEEEVEAVRAVLGDGAAMTGFYSYGELSPFVEGQRCELHNQTMTVTTIREK